MICLIKFSLYIIHNKRTSATALCSIEAKNKLHLILIQIIKKVLEEFISFVFIPPSRNTLIVLLRYSFGGTGKIRDQSAEVFLFGGFPVGRQAGNSRRSVIKDSLIVRSGSFNIPNIYHSQMNLLEYIPL
ncbi:hypothetical protein A2774_00465 [Candidatus Roizmanbacteria bacterium RIFCSPHIGHO2_01_FULL_39_12c]|uniref:Uncharacterized protein n=1 Tax=Candidatus Roizmanbacteria bacterium RIFCSPHIGHO2_01_FULL_39_12c TaxID=1802031 RepID=A0A1F7GDP0_9BACT|nr:MAG: hypothetical protein A2774_00465 [Candidatus Roizmanbacteria bacterium RIFCSPHIGHO2_01_FULL_39_12c]